MKIKQAYVFNKLMKDLMPQELALHEITLHGYMLSDKEFFHELVTNRLQEEAQELADAQGLKNKPLSWLIF